MKSVIIGIIILGAAAFAILPRSVIGFGLNWGGDVLAFLRGGLPVLAIMIGVLAVFIGIADMKDRAEAKREEAENKD